MIRFANGDPSINPVNEFLRKYGVYFAIGIGTIILVIVLIILVKAYKRKKSESLSVSETKQDVNADEIFSCLGSKENVLEHSINGSRIVLVLKDYSLLNETKLNELGVDSIIKMSNKITLVVKGDALGFYKKLF